MTLVPRQFGGNGYLGLFVRFDTYIGTRDNALRVLVRHIARLPWRRSQRVLSIASLACPLQEVKPDSPADLAGLTAREDYILAADDCVFEGLDEFGDYLADKEGDTISLFVYNSASDTVRDVAIMVTNTPWGEHDETGLGACADDG